MYSRKALPIVVFSFLILKSVTGQQVLSTAGANLTGSNIQLSWTIGEPVIETISGTSTLLTQGFHQSRLSVTPGKQIASPDLDFDVYPNPANDLLNVHVKQGSWINYKVCLFSLDGKSLILKSVQNDVETIPMNSFTPGVYLLNILETTGKTVKTYKIVKN